jgi:carbonic anhydrase
MDLCNCNNLDNHDTNFYQSPISLSNDLNGLLYSKTKLKVPGDKIITEYDPESKNWMLQNDVFMHNNGLEYKMIEYHFHTPGEHTINGKRSLMELHCVFQTENSICGIAFLVFGRKHKSSDFLRKTAEGLPVKIPKFDNFYMYAGSLTYVPSTTNLNWIISTKSLYVSERVFESLKSRCKTSRPVQDRFGRTISNVCKK